MTPDEQDDEADVDAVEIDTGTVLYDVGEGQRIHYVVVRTTEGDPVLRPATLADFPG